jgi:hypothetical protein
MKHPLLPRADPLVACRSTDAGRDMCGPHLLNSTARYAIEIPNRMPTARIRRHVELADCETSGWTLVSIVLTCLVTLLTLATRNCLASVRVFF